MNVLQEYAKALVGAVIAALTAAGAASLDHSMTWKDGIAIALAFFLSLSGVAVTKNVLSSAQLQKQPNLPKPPTAYVPGPNVTQSYVDPAYAAELEARAATPKHDPKTGRFTR